VNFQVSLRHLADEAGKITGPNQDKIRDSIVKSIYHAAENIAADSISYKAQKRIDWDRKIDDILTSPTWGFPIMFGMLAAVFWVTIAGANYPS